MTDYEMVSELIGVGGAMFVFIVYYLLMLGFCVVMYVLQSLGTYTLAKRRGIHHPWLAWIPVGSIWLWGCLSDQYQYVVKGRVKNRRKVILVLSIVSLVLAAAMMAGAVSMVMEVITAEGGMPMPQQLLGTLVGILGASLVSLVVAVVLTVFEYMALYDIFRSCEPGNSTLYLVLSILFSVTTTFFLFFSRNKDLGMPPRKEADPLPPQQSQDAPPQEPWENA